MEIAKRKEILKKASAWLNRLMEKDTECEEVALLGDLISMADVLCETSFGTLYPEKSINSNCPGICVSLVHKEFGDITLGFVGEIREENHISSLSWSGDGASSENILINDKILVARKLIEEDVIPF